MGCWLCLEWFQHTLSHSNRALFRSMCNPFSLSNPGLYTDHTSHRIAYLGGSRQLGGASVPARPTTDSANHTHPHVGYNRDRLPNATHRPIRLLYRNAWQPAKWNLHLAG